MIGVGQWAFDSVRKSRVQVIERNELWGYVSYIKGIVLKPS
ncbi:MAG: hypothetical protein PWR01_1859 [Clostridiales bacterium]|nr:hypothetical protein [Clostridiales bacterium]